METCPKPAAPRPAADGRQLPRLAIEASKLPIRGAYHAYRSLFHLKFELLRLFTLPSVSHRDLVSLVSLVRTFLQAPLQLTAPRDNCLTIAFFELVGQRRQRGRRVCV
jgi:hypothetical protein